MVREPGPAQEDCEHDCPDTLEDINLAPHLHPAQDIKQRNNEDYQVIGKVVDDGIGE
jgi:hypothetical protein